MYVPILFLYHNSIMLAAVFGITSPHPGSISSYFTSLCQYKYIELKTNVIFGDQNLLYHWKPRVNHLTHLSHSVSLHGQKDSFFTHFWVILTVYWPTMAQMSQMIHSSFSVYHLRVLRRCQGNYNIEYHNVQVSGQVGLPHGSHHRMR